jgi:hypothetical protein
MWLDSAHKFYVDDNKDNKDVTGPYTLTKVWKVCRDVPKWKTYNENLKNARKRKSFHMEGDSEENDDTVDEMPKRPMGQKAAKIDRRDCWLLCYKVTQDGFNRAHMTTLWKQRKVDKKSL